MALAALVLLGALAWVDARRERAAGRPSPPAWIRWRDPVLWIGLLFLLHLSIQYVNAGRVLYFDTSERAWTYSDPRWPAWPSAITSTESRQMLDWFVPAWVILLVLRSPRLGTRAVRALWRVLVWNAALLSAFGLVQFLSGTTSMYWTVPMRPHFFASFGYPNHAGSYFLMAICLSSGLLLYELAAAGAPLRRGRVALLTAALFLSLLGANFALSRASILLSWGLLLLIAFHALRMLWPRLEPVRRLHTAAAGVAIISLAALLTVGLGREAIRMEFKPEDDNKTLVDREASFRWFQIQTAAHIWLDHPLYGVGGWGYRYLMAHYLPPEQWKRVTEGKANVHNDPMQFLAEFGLIGAGAMSAVVFWLAVPAWRQGRRMLLVRIPLIGVALIAAQSLIDLPFRSPAVLYLWLILLAGAARLAAPRAPANQLNVPRGGGIVPTQ
jgi:hypothetical protein